MHHHHELTVLGLIILISAFVLISVIAAIFKSINKSRKNRLLKKYGKDPAKWEDFANGRTYKQMEAWLNIYHQKY